MGERMQSSIRRFLPLVFLLGITMHPSIADAYSPYHEDLGPVIGGSLGFGIGDAGASGLDGSRGPGLGSGIRIGYVVAPGFDAGVERIMWVHGALTDNTWALEVTAASVTWFPWGRGSYIKAGAGFGSIVHAADSGSTTIKDSDSGLGILLAVGYEVKAYKKLCVGPQIDFGYGKVHDGPSMNFTNLTATMKWYF
jgi:hypothetical protein